MSRNIFLLVTIAACLFSQTTWSAEKRILERIFPETQTVMSEPGPENVTEGTTVNIIPGTTQGFTQKTSGGATTGSYSFHYNFPTGITARATDVWVNSLYQVVMEFEITVDASVPAGQTYSGYVEFKLYTYSGSLQSTETYDYDIITAPNQPPTLSNAALTPLSGLKHFSQEYRYSVIYQDAEGDPPPTTINVYINPQTSNLEVMTLFEGSGDYKTGKEFYQVVTGNYFKYGMNTYIISIGSYATNPVARIPESGTLEGPETHNVDFEGTPTTGNSPLTVQFTDKTLEDTDPHGWEWNFGDGSTSTQQNPVHAYTTAGTYDVTLSAFSYGQRDEVTKKRYITVSEAASPPEASFAATPTSGTMPLSVNFSDKSTGSITGWAWNFGDGGTSAEQNPEHTYNSAGSYTVSLKVTGPGGEDTKTRNSFITVTDPAPAIEAAFSGRPKFGNAPLAVQFTDNSTGTITSWAWDFGDGGKSTEQNPEHTYTKAGDFTVSLKVTGPGGEDTKIRQNYVNVTDVAPIAAFSGTPTSGTSPLVVQFTDNSTGTITSWAWDFGDGDTCTDQNPVHTYLEGGNYSVSLQVTGPSGTDTITKENYVNVKLCDYTGEVSGIWKKSDSPILICGNIHIPANKNLIIEPGVKVIFTADKDSAYGLGVYGQLFAAGTATDSIWFMASNLINGQPGDWGGIQFYQADSCCLEYVNIFHAKTGLDVTSRSPLSVSDCLIKSCESDGVAITADGKSILKLTIVNSKIQNNGGNGIYCRGLSQTNQYHGIARPVISNNEITNNEGHGLLIRGNADEADMYSSNNPSNFNMGESSPKVSGNLISSNKKSGIYCRASGYSFSFWGMYTFAKGVTSPVIQNNIIVNNALSGIELHNSLDPAWEIIAPEICNNTFWGNRNCGLSIQCKPDQSEFKVINNIIAESDSGITKWASVAAPVIQYNDVFSSILNFCGFDSTFGEMIQLNNCNTPCDIYFNISEAPLFANPMNGDFNLMLDSKSIDAGIDIGLPFKSLAPDLGAIESNYSTSVPVEFAAFNAVFSDYKVILEWCTASEANNYGFEIEKSENSKNFSKIGFVKGNGARTSASKFSFQDTQLNPGKSWYRIKQLDINGSQTWSKVVAVDINLALDYTLSANFPNPFNPETKINFTIPEATLVTIEIFNINGEMVRRLVHENLERGSHSIIWDGMSENRTTVASGTYIYRMQANNFVKFKTMLFLK